MSDLVADVAKHLTPKLPPAPTGMHWQPEVWWESPDRGHVTIHAKWRLVPTITFEESE